MSIFHSRPAPYSSFSINLGPLYVERVFDYVLTKEGISGIGQMSTINRLLKYLEYLKYTAIANHSEYKFSLFYKGYFYQQLAKYSALQENIVHDQEKALCYYQTYLGMANPVDESVYYAQWQAGFLQDTLYYPWSQTEESLLEAGVVDPLRGEAIKRVIDHYVHAKEWVNAYRYSSVAVGKFYNNNPIAARRWFVDENAYNWNLMNTHLSICYKLGYVGEANNILSTDKSFTHGAAVN